uniref:DUF7673 family protein n=1 Tax=Sulfuriferula sp. GW6 TaxID=3345112 RepID=UPI0039F6D996
MNNDDKLSPEARAAFDAIYAEREREARERPAIRAAGLEALKRLVELAQGDSGQCRYVASFLLSLYNGNRFKFDLTDFRAIDKAIFDDCMAVLKMDRAPEKEVHCYFENGGALWEQMAKDWNVTDYWALKTRGDHDARAQRGSSILHALRDLSQAVERCEDNAFSDSSRENLASSADRAADVLRRVS